MQKTMSARRRWLRLSVTLTLLPYVRGYCKLVAQPGDTDDAGKVLHPFRVAAQPLADEHQFQVCVRRHSKHEVARPTYTHAAPNRRGTSSS